MFGQPAGQLAGCGKDFNNGHFMQTFQPNIFIAAMLIGTNDLELLSLTLTFSGGHKVSKKQNLLG